MRSRYAARKDNNHSAIVNKLREIPGVDVYVHSFDPWDISIGFRNQNFFYEIKTDAKKKLTEAQDNFHKRWNGHWKRVESVDEILLDLKLIQFPKPRLQDEIA